MTVDWFELRKHYSDSYLKEFLEFAYQGDYESI